MKKQLIRMSILVLLVLLCVTITLGSALAFNISEEMKSMPSGYSIYKAKQGIIVPLESYVYLTNTDVIIPKGIFEDVNRTTYKPEEGDLILLKLDENYTKYSHLVYYFELPGISTCNLYAGVTYSTTKIKTVYPYSSAEEAGLEDGDLILELFINDSSVFSVLILRDEVAHTITVYKGDVGLALDETLGSSWETPAEGHQITKTTTYYDTYAVLNTNTKITNSAQNVVYFLGYEYMTDCGDRLTACFSEGY